MIENVNVSIINVSEVIHGNLNFISNSDKAMCLQSIRQLSTYQFYDIRLFNVVTTFIFILALFLFVTLIFFSKTEFLKESLFYMIFSFLCILMYVVKNPDVYSIKINWYLIFMVLHSLGIAGYCIYAAKYFMKYKESISRFVDKIMGNIKEK